MGVNINLEYEGHGLLSSTAPPEINYQIFCWLTLRPGGHVLAAPQHLRQLLGICLPIYLHVFSSICISLSSCVVFCRSLLDKGLLTSSTYLRLLFVCSASLRKMFWCYHSSSVFFCFRTVFHNHIPRYLFCNSDCPLILTLANITYTDFNGGQSIFNFCFFPNLWGFILASPVMTAIISSSLPLWAVLSLRANIS